MFTYQGCVPMMERWPYGEVVNERDLGEKIEGWGGKRLYIEK